MSGIAGIVHFDGRPVEPGQIERMTSAMAHRGPDGIHHWVKGSAAFGQCMLRTTPESLEEYQPLANEDESLVLVMDGRVDNWEELRVDLLGRGAVLRNRSDAELVLRAYETWGEECPEQIIGEFVFLIWDSRERRLFGARDAAGTRHFYYSEGNGWFGFASEIKGLLTSGLIEARLNESRVLDYLVVEFDRDDEVGTFYQGINRLPAGHALLVNEVGLKTWRYWKPGELTEMKFSSLEECTEAFMEQFSIAVKCRLRSIGPIGAMLSGGLDSSSIVGLISNKHKGELAEPLKTYSLIREDLENCPDWASIQKILEESNWIVPHITSSAVGRDTLQSFLDKISDADEPFLFSHGYTYFLIYRAAQLNGCKVVLDGMAGDLLFYSNAATLTSLTQRREFNQIFHKLAISYRYGRKEDFREIIKGSTRGLLTAIAPRAVRGLYRNIKIERKLISDDFRLLHKEVARDLLREKYSQRHQKSCQFGSHNDQVRHSRYFTSGLLSFAHEVYGQIAFSCEVEPRSPFSDRRMIEFAIRMPIDKKMYLSWYKNILREAMAGILPEEVRWRENIGGHPGWKFHEYLIAEMRHSAQDIWNLEQTTDTLGRWIHKPSLNQRWLKYERNKIYNDGKSLYPLAILTKWLQCQPTSMQLTRKH